MVFENLIDLIAKFKVYFGSAAFYLSFINFILILATFKITYGINLSAYVLIPVGFVLILIVGFLDYKLILLSQTKHSNKKNDLKIQMDRIESKLDLLLGDVK
jgi:hypothetical protein